MGGSALGTRSQPMKIYIADRVGRHVGMGIRDESEAVCHSRSQLGD